MRHLCLSETIPLYYFRFTSILSSHLRSGFRKACLLVGFRPNVCIYHLYNIMYIPCPIMKLLIMQFSPVTCCFRHLRAQCSAQHFTTRSIMILIFQLVKNHFWINMKFHRNIVPIFERLNPSNWTEFVNDLRLSVTCSSPGTKQQVDLITVRNIHTQLRGLMRRAIWIFDV